MKILLLPLLFCSVMLFAQEKKQTIPKVDSLKTNLNDTISFKEASPEYKILVSKPENPSMYSSLKAEKTDSVQYKILNPLRTRKEKTND